MSVNNIFCDTLKKTSCGVFIVMLTWLVGSWKKVLGGVLGTVAFEVKTAAQQWIRSLLGRRFVCWASVEFRLLCK